MRGRSARVGDEAVRQVLAHETLHRAGHADLVLGFLASEAVRRRKCGMEPFTIMSCDNIQGNGHVAQEVFTASAAAA